MFLAEVGVIVNIFDRFRTVVMFFQNRHNCVKTVDRIPLLEVAEKR